MAQPQIITDLGLGIFGASVASRKKKDIQFVLGAELTEEDAQLGREPIAQKAVIQDIRRSHHELAKYVAQGLKNVVIAELTGYSPARISVLKSDPQFAELVEHYSTIEDEIHLASRADYHTRLADLGFDSIEVLHQRLLDSPEVFAVKELLQVVEATSDRIGHGKTSTQNLNVQTLTLSAKELADIRNGADSSAPDPSGEKNYESLLRLAVRATSALPGGEEVSGSESEGSGVREEGGEEPATQLRGNDNIPSVD